MEPGQYLAFVGVSLLVICTPGQDTALTIRNTLTGGRAGGLSTALGVSSGQAVWTLATSAGLAVVLTASAPLFLAIRLAGAAYLIYLGARSLLGAVWAKSGHNGERAVTRPPALSPRGAYAQGLLSNLGNPKMVAFFVSLLPPFAGPHAGLALLLGLNFSLLTLAWLCGYAFAVARMRRWLELARVRRAMEGLMGAVLVALGIRVGAEALTA